MGTFAAGTVKELGMTGSLKIAVITCAGSGSYATGGDTLDLSNAAAGLANSWLGFNEVFAVEMGGMDAAANSKYKCTYLAATAGAAATGKVKINDVTAASGAEVSNATDLSGVTFTFVVFGR